MRNSTIIKFSKKLLLGIGIAATIILTLSATIIPFTSDRLKIDTDNCIKCGNCEAVAPDCIVIDGEGTPWVMVGWENYPDQYINAIEGCPVDAISLKHF